MFATRISFTHELTYCSLITTDLECFLFYDNLRHLAGPMNCQIFYDTHVAENQKVFVIQLFFESDNIQPIADSYATWPRRVLSRIARFHSICFPHAMEAKGLLCTVHWWVSPTPRVLIDALERGRQESHGHLRSSRKATWGTA